MVDYTPNLRLALPAFDQTPWDEDVNNNFRVIDAALNNIFSIPGFTGLWQNNQAYVVDQIATDPQLGGSYKALLSHTSANSPTTFAQERAAHPELWALTAISGTLYLPLAGGELTGPIQITTTNVDGGVNGSFINLDSAMGTDNIIAGKRSGGARWLMALGDEEHEGTGNTGTKFVLNAYSNSGVFLGGVFSIKRSDRVVDFAVMPTLNGVPLVSSPSSSLPLTGGTLTGPLKDRNTTPDIGDGGASIAVENWQGTNNNIIGNRVDGVGTFNRWVLVLGNDTHDTGANAGSDFELKAYSDIGALIGSPITIERATQIVDFAVPPTVAGLSINAAYMPLAGGTFSGAVIHAGTTRFNGNVGFYNTAPVAKPTVTGIRQSNTALASLLTALVSLGLLVDSTTAT